MMSKQRQEKRRKFHESLVNMLYVSPPCPPPQKNTQKEILPEELQETILKAEHITDELEEEKSSVSASDDESELDTRKLTRAQRKRLRKKRLKEAALNRRKIVGPELPGGTDMGTDNLHSEGGEAVENHQTQDVRQNAAEGLEIGSDQQLGDTTSCTSQNKRKQRRVSRKLAKEKVKPLTMKDWGSSNVSSTYNEA